MTLSRYRWNAMLLAAIVAWGTSASADLPGIDGQDVVYLLQDCSGAGKNLGTDCVQNVDDLQTLIWGTSGINPTSTTPLVVDIGVGEFSGTLHCQDGGYVTFRGVGQERTKLVQAFTGQSFIPTFFVGDDCQALEFQDLTIESTSGAFPIAVAWQNGGSSIWTDVTLRASYSPWIDLDTTCSTESPPVHYFFGSRIQSTGSYGYAAACGEHWIYGSEVRLEATATTPQADQTRRGVAVSGPAQIQLFGSSIRVFPAPGFPLATDFIGVKVGQAVPGGTFHMHGGIISASAQGPGVDAIGIDTVDSTAFAHTLGTAFVVKKGSGSAIRTRGPGTIQSPLLWQSGPDAPVGGVQSLTGKDIFVETDCNAADCSSGGSDPHLMIYSAACGANPWFDVVLGACRS